jgi:hypothetical protein
MAAKEGRKNVGGGCGRKMATVEDYGGWRRRRDGGWLQMSVREDGSGGRRQMMVSEYCYGC